ncbi:hypothetical protein DBR32_12320 [Taibaiella sp. KBW10]|uniref:aminotransferase class IV n=1 Tax=Taibaiella sp. KBW10 TaxID=2153357 RepID=UPI000F593F41|nr:aminotransferase class IV [Taibaiella sp. KBW10]RQO30349.1 hypothetical protein DBR32_12320 [Taibaiella sp. KBW10]
MKTAIGLIETMYWNGHTIDLWPHHLLRLQKGLEQYQTDVDEDELREQCFYKIKQSADPKQPKKLRLEVYPAPEKAEVNITVSDFKRTEGITLTLGFASGICIQSTRASGLKTTDRALYDKAQEQAAALQYSDMILHNEKGHLVETAIYNIIWKEKGKPDLYTPDIKEGCIAGVMRHYLLTKGFITEAILTKDLLGKAESVWVCNALRGIIPVRSIAGRVYEIRETGITL